MDWAEGLDWESDALAGFEEYSFPKADDLPGRLKEGENRLKLAIQSVLRFCIPSSVVIAFLLFWIGAIILAIHTLTPWKWLAAGEVTHLQNLLFSTFVGGAVASGARRYLPQNDNNA